MPGLGGGTADLRRKAPDPLPRASTAIPAFAWTDREVVSVKRHGGLPGKERVPAYKPLKRNDKCADLPAARLGCQTIFPLPTNPISQPVWQRFYLAIASDLPKP